MCYLEPIYRWEVKGREKEKPIIDKKVLERFVPEYVKDLKEVGIDINQLFDKKTKAFIKKSELEKNPAFEPLQTIGRVKRKGEWKKVKIKGLKRVLQKSLDIFPKKFRTIFREKKKLMV